MSAASIDFSKVQNLDQEDEDFEKSLADKKKKMDKFKKQLESKEKLKAKADKRKVSLPLHQRPCCPPAKVRLNSFSRTQRTTRRPRTKS